jgi:two-component system, LuxR family, sensor kinase FixL
LANDLPNIFANRTQIQQVLVNLERNAIEAMANSQSREIRIATAHDGRTARITVSDTGPGLPPEVALSPFQPFRTTKPSGLGLGLSICRSIVEAHGGSITVTTGSNGATFTLGFPIATEERRGDVS